MKNDFMTEKLKKGETVCFGRYPQKRDPSAAPEPIEWIILETEEKSVKLISRYGLTAKAFHDYGGWPVTWESCTLRTWLNSDFLNAAFTDEEQQRLAIVTVEAEYDQFTETNDTRDKVFVLNAEEAEKYFGCWWWLRTPSISMPNFVYVVNTDGSFDADGFPVTAFGENDKDNIAVRPAIVLNLDRLRPNR